LGKRPVEIGHDEIEVRFAPMSRRLGVDPAVCLLGKILLDPPSASARYLVWNCWSRSLMMLRSVSASGKILDTHSVGSICDQDFGVFTVTNIATENTDAVPPAHPIPRMPKAPNQGLQRCRGPRVSLTCLAPLAAWQSLCTGHVDASLENSVDWPSPTGAARQR
jgi:hypothetical protein